MHFSTRLSLRSLVLLAVLTGCALREVAAEMPVVPDQPIARGAAPGIVIDASTNPAAEYIGSPSIAILSNGDYVASHDWFGPGTTNDRSALFLSKDRGETWTKAAQLQGQWWSTLFPHRGALYILGVDREYGNIVIRRSTDGGRTWTTPADENSGRLFPGSFHCAPVPVVLHQGRLWRAFEEKVGNEGWPRHFHSLVTSVPEDADLLVAANWRRSNALEFETIWTNAKRPGWLEGNIVTTPSGKLINLLRFHSEPGPDDRYELIRGGKNIPRAEAAAVMNISEDGHTQTFDPPNGFIHFPGSLSKFTIRFDPVSRRYWSLVQKVTNPYSGYNWALSPYHQRNVLMLTSSTDLRSWREDFIVLRFREGAALPIDGKVGFQYVDWQFDGDDLALVSRTAWNGHTYHDANYLTFHRVKNFRLLRLADSPADLADRRL